MNLKKGWVTAQVTEEIMRIATPFKKLCCCRVEFYMTDLWLTDDRQFWLQVRGKFHNEIDMETNIKPILEKYGVQYDPAGKKIFYPMGNVIGNLNKELVAIYKFGEALNELYQINFESEGEDAK